MFPVITPEIQKKFEDRRPENADRIPKICGYCGRACYQMGKPEGANRFICTSCPLSYFAMTHSS